MPNHPQSLRFAFGIGLALLTAVCGCALPDYQLPQGFSSTYYRHLQQSQSVMQVQGTEPAVIETPAKSRWWHGR